MSYTETRFPVKCPLCFQGTNVDGEGMLYDHNNEDGEECPASGEEYCQ